MANGKCENRRSDRLKKQQCSCLLSLTVVIISHFCCLFPKIVPIARNHIQLSAPLSFQKPRFPASCQNGGHPWLWRCIALYLPGRTEDRVLRMISPNHHFQFSKLPRMPRSHYTKSPPGSARLIPSNDRQDRDRVGRRRIWEEAGRVGKEAAMEVWDGKGGKCLMFRSPFPSTSRWVAKEEGWMDNKSWMGTPQHKECPILHIGSTVWKVNQLFRGALGEGGRVGLERGWLWGGGEGGRAGLG